MSETTNRPQNPVLDPVQVDAVAEKAEEIVDKHNCRNPLSETVHLHKYCVNQIRYKRYEELRSPEDVLATGDGDCRDQSVLLASMLLAREIPVRFVHVQDHMFPEALLKTIPENISEKKVRRLYNVSRDTEIWILGDRNRHTSIDDEGYWYAVDSEMSRYLGDLQIHAEERLLVEKDDRWEWDELEFCKAFEPDSTTRKNLNENL